MSLRGHIYASNISLLFIHLRPVVLHAFIQVFSRIFLRPDLNHRNRILCTCDANIAGTTCHPFTSLSRAPYCIPRDHPLRTGRRNVDETYIVFCFVFLNRSSDIPQLFWDVGRCEYSWHCFWKKPHLHSFWSGQNCSRKMKSAYKWTHDCRSSVLATSWIGIHANREQPSQVNNYRPHLLSCISANIIIFEVGEGKSVAITHVP